METPEDRRKHQRLPLRLSVLCHKVGLSVSKSYTGNTINVSPGGMLMEINNRGLNEGDLLSVEMSVPPTKGLLEYGGRFSSYARILRMGKTRPVKSSRYSSTVQTMALEFCESPKLNVV